MILALDVSSVAIGYAFWDTELVMSGVWKPKKAGQDYWRLRILGRKLEKVLKEICLTNELLEVIVEEPFYAPGKSRDTPIKMMHGIILWLLAENAKRNFSLNYVGVSTWRKGMLPAKCSKKDKKTIIMGKMGKEFKVAIEDDNHADALGILKWRLRNG